MNVAKRITELRKLKGYSTNKLAITSDLSQGFVRQIELGKKQPTVDSLRKICNGLGISLHDFFSDETVAIPLDIESLINVAKTLTPEQRRALQSFLELMKK
ncbi:helix-turn-helix domain-containing protein [Pectinatus haikarae]|uniref:Transcriptional regulator with XRE-family HTH domain n=1 Tax=Pectinatus haikarae TaxID=349096 RepID=A0ABT9Y3Y9_9FIRM|nr:helix-turn-helix transcriptional regulator [Pectinatus haikarae]MDQ0202538.1 transcriptional regulator with XRE-family HTH domain [Pectinatus haikarae]